MTQMNAVLNHCVKKTYTWLFCSSNKYYCADYSMQIYGPTCICHNQHDHNLHISFFCNSFICSGLSKFVLSAVSTSLFWITNFYQRQIHNYPHGTSHTCMHIHCLQKVTCSACYNFVIQLLIIFGRVHTENVSNQNTHI